jgi:hypothetical protein
MTVYVKCEGCGRVQENRASRDDYPAGCFWCAHEYASNAVGPTQRPGVNGRRSKRKRR